MQHLPTYSRHTGISAYETISHLVLFNKCCPLYLYFHGGVKSPIFTRMLSELWHIWVKKCIHIYTYEMGDGFLGAALGLSEKIHY